MALLSVSLDNKQGRLGRERLFTLASKDAWDVGKSTNVWIEPVHKDVLLNPVQRMPEWATTGTGLFQRLQLSDFICNNGQLASVYPGFFTADDKFVGDTFICHKDFYGKLYTVASYGANTGFYVSYFSYGTGNSAEQNVYLGWGANQASGVDVGHSIALGFTNDGRAQVFDHNRSVNAPDIEYGFTTGGSGRGQNAGKFVELLMIPWRRNELLVVDNYGGHFSHVFTSIDESDPHPIITEAGQFFIHFESSVFKVQICPVRYNYTGSAVATPSAWARPPNAGELWNTRFIGDTYDGGSALVNIVDPLALSTQFVADGVRTQFRINVNLTAELVGGVPVATPYLYGGCGGYEPLYDDTADTPTLIDDNFIMQATLDVPEHAASAKFGLKIRNPSLLDAAISTTTGGEGGYSLFNGSNRVLNAKIGSLLIFDGLGVPPQFEVKENTDVDSLTIEARDYYKQMEEITFRDPIPLDGLALNDALKFVANSAGIKNDKILLETNSYVLPNIGANWNVLIEAGDSCLHWWERLIEDFAGNWMHGVVPYTNGMFLQAGSVNFWGNTSLLTLYASLSDAIAAGHSPNDGDPDAAWRFVYKNYRERPLEPEANEIWVTGWDTRTNRPFQIFKVDYASQNPSLDVVSRPSNWLGGPRKYGLQDKSITTKAIGTNVCNLLFNRLTSTRVASEWEVPLPFEADGLPAWRGDLITLQGRGIFRINSLACRFTSNTARQSYWPCTMTGSRNIDIIGRTAGSNLEQIHSQHLLRCVDKVVRRGDWRDLATQAAQEVISV